MTLEDKLEKAAPVIREVMANSGSDEQIRIKNPTEFLLESGLLFEINRRVLHPLGMAMALVINVTGDEEYGILSIIDSRDDPEGFVYGTDLFNSGKNKFSKYMDSDGKKIIRSRTQLLGFKVQTKGMK